MANRSPAASWCFLRDNPRIRGIVLYLKEKRGLTAVDLADAAGLDVDRVRKYLRNSKPNLNQAQLIKLCNILGVELEIVVSVKEYNS